MTSKYEIPDPTNVPPIIQDDELVSVAKIGSTIWLDSEQPKSWTFAVQVRDEDTEQVLDARWRLVKQGEPVPAFNRLDPLAAGKLVRPVSFPLGSTLLSDGECHHLELAVSGHFWRNPRTGLEQTEPWLFAEVTPDFPDDLALASWTIWEGKGKLQATDDEKVRLVDSCGADESQLGNPSSVEAPR